MTSEYKIKKTVLCENAIRLFRFGYCEANAFFRRRQGYIMRTETFDQSDNEAFSGLIKAQSVAKANSGETETATGKKVPALVVIDSRTLFRECMARCLEQLWRGELRVVAVPSVQAWQAIADKVPASLILLGVFNKSSGDAVHLELKALREAANPVPAVVISDTEELDHILGSLEHGARGFISSNLSFDIAVEAMRFVKAGGTFVPANSLLMAQRSNKAMDEQPKTTAEFFTSRQVAVVEALRMGKPNKSIAYELNMCESTVKVHVRNIMKKLKAKNRTQVAFIANKMLR